MGKQLTYGPHKVVSPAKPRIKLYLRHVPLNNGGYEKDGTYWGVGERLYHFMSDGGDMYDHIRCMSRNAAKIAIRQRLNWADVHFYGG